MGGLRAGWPGELALVGRGGPRRRRRRRQRQSSVLHSACPAARPRSSPAPGLHANRSPVCSAPTRSIARQWLAGQAPPAYAEVGPYAFKSWEKRYNISFSQRWTEVGARRVGGLPGMGRAGAGQERWHLARGSLRASAGLRRLSCARWRTAAGRSYLTPPPPPTHPLLAHLTGGVHVPPVLQL